jgi:putative transposase
MLEYKLSDRGKHFIKIDRWFSSSQLCSCCGNRKKLELSERKYICACGLEIDRDLNAAINIKNEGLRLLA